MTKPPPKKSGWKHASTGIYADKTMAIGFCFGDGTVLELARTGTESIQGVVFFHGDLKSPTLKSDTKQIKMPVLVLLGADDPYVPQADVQTFVETMNDFADEVLK
mgnify:CR=1 FL=1